MEENPSPIRRKEKTHKSISAGNNRRRGNDDGGDISGGEDPIDCSFKNCPSCAAGVIADCIAVCCCPLAVVSILALAFVKVPWTMGKRCFRLGRKKRRRLKKKTATQGTTAAAAAEITGDSDGISRMVGVDEEILEILSSGFGEEELLEDNSVWLELYQIGQLGFGRVSFTGIQQSLGKGN